MTDPLVPMSFVSIIAASKAGVTASVSFLQRTLSGAEIGHEMNTWATLCILHAILFGFFRPFFFFF